MNHQWQQPIRPLEVHPNNNETGMWYPVLFIRPGTDRGWQVITHSGVLWESSDALIRSAT